MSFTVPRCLTERLWIGGALPAFPHPLRRSSEIHPWQRPNLRFHPGFFCTLYHIPGTVSGSMQWCQKSHCCCVLYIFFSLGLALSSLARHLPLVVSPISLLSVPHCVISVSGSTSLSCSAVLKEEDHSSTAALYISIFPACGHKYAGIEHYTICDCWTSIFICSHSAARVLVSSAWPCSQSVFRIRTKVRALCKPFLHWPGFVHEEDKPIQKTDKRVKDSTSLIHRCKEDLLESAVRRLSFQVIAHSLHTVCLFVTVCNLYFQC